MEPLLTTEDVAEFFRVDVVTVRRMIGKGELTAYRVGGEYRFARADIEDYLERTRLPARQEPHGRLQDLKGRAGKLVPSGLRGPSSRGASRAFERFTDQARTALARAQEEAHQLGHPYLGTEHILLGLVGDGDDGAARVLSLLGVRPANVRDTVESVIDRGEDEMPGELGITPRAKRVLELAVTEATQLDQTYVGTEHLLLGLVHEGEGVAAKVLHSLGIQLTAARRAVQEMSPSQDGG